MGSGAELIPQKDCGREYSENCSLPYRWRSNHLHRSQQIRHASAQVDCNYYESVETGHPEQKAFSAPYLPPVVQNYEEYRGRYDMMELVKREGGTGFSHSDQEWAVENPSSDCRYGKTIARQKQKNHACRSCCKRARPQESPQRNRA